MILLSPRERKTSISVYVAGKIKFKPCYFLDLNGSKIRTRKCIHCIYSFIYLKISLILEKQRTAPHLGHICLHMDPKILRRICSRPFIAVVEWK